MSYKKNMDKIKKGLKGLAEEALEKGKEAAYTAAAGAEQHASFGGLSKLVKGVFQKGKEAKAYVDEKGGLANVVIEAQNQVDQAVDRAIDRLGEFYDKINAHYEEFGKEFFPEGKIDKEKARDALKNASALSEKYGKKAVDQLRQILAKGTESASTSYRDFSPDRNERETTYAGIGDKVPFYILTRANGDKCLDFHEKIRTSIAGRPKYKGQLLADIKAYAITDREELNEFYKASGNNEMLEVLKGL